MLTERGWIAAADLGPDDRIATGQGLSRIARDVVCGSLLGDANIGEATSHLQMAHSTRQREYALFKSGLLRELEPQVDELVVAAVAGGAREYGAIHVRTHASRALRILRGEFYEPEKHVPAWIADELNERMLAFWFMDDGYTRIRDNRRPRAEIATCAFDDGDIAFLLRGLARLGLPAKALRGRIHFDCRGTVRLSELIAPFVPPSMRYKLHPEVERGVLFEPSAVQAGPVEVLYDAVEVQDVTDELRSDTTFFCIDVDETHNFVTAGGVVHNCRPPGNRDPAPDEIEACESHLFRQIELIEPTVVATLGNFATKLLSGRPLGITRVHGQEQQTTIGSRSVLLYPLYHPAAALYTPAMLKVLESDFARLPELLGRTPEPAAAPEPELALVAPPAAGRAARAVLGLNALDGDHAEVGGALAERLRRLVLGRVVEAPDRLEVLELEHDQPLRLPVALEHGQLAAAGEETPAAGGHRAGRRGLVQLVLLGVVDVGFDDEIRRHGRDSTLCLVMDTETTSPEETAALAGRLAARLAPGDVVTVAGELGTGKTTFVRGACEALGVRERVTSPTYTIGHRYHAAQGEVSHLDLYRFRGVSAAEWGDLEPYFDSSIAFVEWPEAGDGVLPPPRFSVRLRHAGGARRVVSIDEC